ncbi:MAG: prohibitin family protein [Candidatus Hydrogenedentes bacterium]|nr:prohibitin family protein [Candidatus Hydrogenedentota bacterium]
MKTQRLSLAVAALLLSTLSGCLPYSTGPTEVGVRTIKFGWNKGIEKTVYAPGSTYFFVPFLTDWHTFDTRLRNLEMTLEGSSDGRSRDELLFKTIDGNDISLDVIISYRIDPERAPDILQLVGLDDDDVEEKIVRTIARSRPRDIFGELNTEEFYIADSRAKKALEVEVTLNDMLKGYGVIVERVNTQDYRFNPAYQEAIENKKVADQQAEKLRSETLAVTEEYTTKVAEAKATVNKIKAGADGEYQRSLIEADAYYQQQRRIAEATLAEGKAEAEGIRELNAALSGPGGANVVKLAIAEALQNKRIVMLPFGEGGLDVRSTDINQLLSLYGVKTLGEKAKRPAPEAPAAAPAVEPAPAAQPAQVDPNQPLPKLRRNPR